MPTSPSALNPDQLRARFAQLLPLLAEEWPDLNAVELEATAGDADALVELIATRTDQTRALTRRQLAELLTLVSTSPRRPRPAAQSSAASSSPAVEPLDRLVHSLEEYLDDLTRQVKRDVAPLALNSARENMGLALLLAGGFGLTLGLFLGAMGYPHEKLDDDATD